MSEPTLYQVEPEDTDQQLLDAVAELIELGVLVPVEPDYEAAWGYARHEDNGHIAARNNDNMVVLDKYDVMAVVDAALGIGDNE